MQKWLVSLNDAHPLPCGDFVVVVVGVAALRGLLLQEELGLGSEDEAEQSRSSSLSLSPPSSRDAAAGPIDL